MHKDLYKFPCPCCGKKIEIDVRTGRARAVSTGSDGDNPFGDLLSAQKRDQERLGEAFDSARQRQIKQQEELDRKLEQAKEDARDAPDEEVRRPFDLD
jgi:hypothetical protein